jgi:hypothetical protein
MNPFPDTSRNVTAPVTTRTPRRRIPTRVFFAFELFDGSQSPTPLGYEFNGRGDLISIDKRDKRRRIATFGRGIL